MKIARKLTTPTLAEIRRLPDADFGWWTFRAGDRLDYDSWVISFRATAEALHFLGVEPRRQDDEAIDRALQLLACGGLADAVPEDVSQRRPHEPRQIWDEDFGWLQVEVIGGPSGLTVVLLCTADEAQRFPGALEQVRGLYHEIMRTLDAKRGHA